MLEFVMLIRNPSSSVMTHCGTVWCEPNYACFFLQLLKLCNTVSQEPITQFKYDHQRYIARPVLALGEFCLQRTVQAVRSSPFFSIITDLSSDVADHENMIIYVRYWDTTAFQPVTEYLCCVQLIGKDGASMAQTITDVCDVLDLPLATNVIALCADGDPAMQGHINGLLGNMRASCDHVLGSHCAAHRHVLAVGDTATSNVLLKLLDDILLGPYNLFNRRLKYVSLWELFGSENGVTALKFLFFNQTRWWSRAVCVTQLRKCLPVLLAFLTGMCKRTSKWYWPQAEAVKVQLKRPIVLVVLHFTADLLDVLEHSRKLFESKGARLSELEAEVNTAIAQLTEFASSCTSLRAMPGQYMKSICEATNCFVSNRADGHVHAILQTEKFSFSTVLEDERLPEDIVTQLADIPRAFVTNLQRRFPERELALITSFRCVDPALYARVAPMTATRNNMGEGDLKSLLAFLSTPRSQATGSQFWCRAPVITASEDEV